METNDTLCYEYEGCECDTLTMPCKDDGCECDTLTMPCKDDGCECDTLTMPCEDDVLGLRLYYIICNAM